MRGPVDDDARSIQPLGVKSFSDFVDQRGRPGSRLSDHQSTISWVCKAASMEDTLNEKRFTDALWKFLVKPATFFNKRLQDMGFPDHVQLRAAPLPVGHGVALRPQFDCNGFTSKAQARVKKEKHGI